MHCAQPPRITHSYRANDCDGLMNELDCKIQAPENRPSGFSLIVLNANLKMGGYEKIHTTIWYAWHQRSIVRLPFGEES